MKVPPPMRRLRFTLDVCYTSRGEVVGCEAQVRDSLKGRREMLGGSSGDTAEMVPVLLRKIEKRIRKATK